MSTTENRKARGKYKKREERTYWGVYWLYRAEHPLREIARIMEIPYTTVNNIVKRIKERDTPMPSAPPGATRKADERAMRHLKLFVTKNPSASVNEVKLELENIGVKVTSETVANYLRELGSESS